MPRSAQNCPKLPFFGLPTPSGGQVRVRTGSVDPLCTPDNSGSDHYQPPGSRMAKIYEKVHFGHFWALLGTSDLEQKLQFLGLPTPSRGHLGVRTGSLEPLCTPDNSGSDHDQPPGSRMATFYEKVHFGNFWALLSWSKNCHFWAFLPPPGAK